MLYSGWPIHSPLLDFFTRYNINMWLKWCKNRWMKNKHSSAETMSHVQFVIYIAYMTRKGRRQRINMNRDLSLGLWVRAEATHTKINAQIVNNGYANPSSAKVPTFKQSLYIIHSMWSQIVSAFRFFLHSSLSCLVQPSNQSASCTLNEILLNFCILTWEKCKVEAESSSSLTSQLPGILGSMVFLIDLLIISAKIAQNHQKNNLLHCF